MPLLYDELDTNRRFLAGRDVNPKGDVLTDAPGVGEDAAAGQPKAFRGANVVSIHEVVPGWRSYVDRQTAGVPINDFSTSLGGTGDVKPLHLIRTAK